MQDSSAAIQSAHSTKLPDIRIQQYSFEMCTAKLFGHPTDAALSIDSRINTKYWKVQQLTYSGHQELQHHLLITDRFLKRIWGIQSAMQLQEHFSRTAFIVLCFNCQ